MPERFLFDNVPERLLFKTQDTPIAATHISQPAMTCQKFFPTMRQKDISSMRQKGFSPMRFYFVLLKTRQ